MIQLGSIGLGGIYLEPDTDYDYGLGFCATDPATVSNIPLCFMRPIEKELLEWRRDIIDLGRRVPTAVDDELRAHFLALEGRVWGMRTRLAIAMRRRRTP